MKLALSLASLLVCMAVSIECQPLADARSNYINFFFEMLNPSFRQHRGRLRPFLNQLGSPVINIRGSRDVSKQLELLDDPEPRPQCIFSANTIVCSAKNGKAMNYQCDATSDLATTKLAQIKEYAIGTVQIVKQKNILQPVFKAYIYGKAEDSTWLDANQTNPQNHKLETYSMHDDNQLVTDLGIKVTDNTCWMDMVRFLLGFNSKTQDIVISETNTVVKTIGSLTVFLN